MIGLVVQPESVPPEGLVPIVSVIGGRVVGGDHVAACVLDLDDRLGCERRTAAGVGR